MNAPRKQLAATAGTLTGRELGEAFDYWPPETRPGCLLGVVIGLLRVQGLSDPEIRRLVIDGLGFVEKDIPNPNEALREQSLQVERQN